MIFNMIIGIYMRNNHFPWFWSVSIGIFQFPFLNNNTVKHYQTTTFNMCNTNTTYTILAHVSIPHYLSSSNVKVLNISEIFKLNFLKILQSNQKLFIQSLSMGYSNKMVFDIYIVHQLVENHWSSVINDLVEYLESINNSSNHSITNIPFQSFHFHTTISNVWRLK